jgi:hypothetical protein
MESAADAGTLANIASVIGAFGAAMLYFRIQRELSIEKEGEPIWLPWADRLLIAATIISLIFVILPLTSFASLRLPSAAGGAAAILVAGYPPAIMAHYRIWFGRDRKGTYKNPEPAERVWVWLTSTAALLFFVWRILAPSN